jgi:hypothetical protein
LHPIGRIASKTTDTVRKHSDILIQFFVAAIASVAGMKMAAMTLILF